MLCFALLPCDWLKTSCHVSQPISNQSNRTCQMTRVFPPSAPVTFAILERKGNWTDPTFAKNGGTATRDKEGNWPIADRLVPNNDPRNNFGTHFGPSSLPFSKVANAWDVIATWPASVKTVVYVVVQFYPWFKFYFLFVSNSLSYISTPKNKRKQNLNQE